MKQSDQQGYSGKKPNPSPRRIASWILLFAGVCVLAFSIRWKRPSVPQNSEPTLPLSVPSIPSSTPASSSAPVLDLEYLKDKLFITQERADYQSGQMVLKIPRMGLDVAVQGGVSNEDMDIAPGLFDYSQLPGAEGCNVSIGVHRDIKGAEFYFIHKLTSGDLFHLVYNQKIYVYEYKDTKVIEPSDWGPIYMQGFDCLTLISCTPIGTSRQRIVVRAQLKETLPYTTDYVYRPWVEGMDKPYAWEPNAKSWDAQPQSRMTEESSQPMQQSSVAGKQ